jgi:hypothetical protein
LGGRAVLHNAGERFNLNDAAVQHAKLSAREIVALLKRR